MPNLKLYSIDQIGAVRSADIEQNKKVALIAEMCRVNVLTTIKQAGSGHLGSSLSALDIITYLLEVEL